MKKTIVEVGVGGERGALLLAAVRDPAGLASCLAMGLRTLGLGLLGSVTQHPEPPPPPLVPLRPVGTP